MVQSKILSFQKKVKNCPLKIAVHQINTLKEQLKNIVPKKLVLLILLPCHLKVYYILKKCGTAILVKKNILIFVSF